jgi:hypothetical protein
MLATSDSRFRALALVRTSVGLGLIVAPRALGRTTDPSLALLIRTVGIRDLVLGLGGVTAADDAGVSHWGRAALLSDSIDIVAGAVALPRVGLKGGLVAALSPVPFVAAGLAALLAQRGSA